MTTVEQSQYTASSGQETTVSDVDITEFDQYVDPNQFSDHLRSQITYNNHRVAVEEVAQAFEEVGEQYGKVVDLLLNAAKAGTAPPPDISDQFIELDNRYESTLRKLASVVEELEAVSKDEFSDDLRQCANQFEYACNSMVKRGVSLRELVDQLVYISDGEVTIDQAFVEAHEREIISEIETLATEAEEMEDTIEDVNLLYKYKMNVLSRTDRGMMPVWWIPTLTGPLPTSPVRSILQFGSWVLLLVAVGYGATAGPILLAVVAPLVFLIAHDWSTALLGLVAKANN